MRTLKKMAHAAGEISSMKALAPVRQIRYGAGRSQLSAATARAEQAIGYCVEPYNLTIRHRLGS